jgi:hypothetical protein
MHVTHLTRHFVLLIVLLPSIVIVVIMEGHHQPERSTWNDLVSAAEFVVGEANSFVLIAFGHRMAVTGDVVDTTAATHDGHCHRQPPETDPAATDDQTGPPRPVTATDPRDCWNTTPTLSTTRAQPTRPTRSTPLAWTHDESASATSTDTIDAASAQDQNASATVTKTIDPTLTHAENIEITMFLSWVDVGPIVSVMVGPAFWSRVEAVSIVSATRPPGEGT